VFHFNAKKKSGSGDAILAADDNAVTFGGVDFCNMIFKGDGDVWNHGGSTTMSTFDAHDDRQLALNVRSMQGADVSKHVLHDFAERYRSALVAGRVASPDGNGGWFFSNRGLHALALDYTRQVQDQVAALVEALDRKFPGVAEHVNRTMKEVNLPDLPKNGLRPYRKLNDVG
jgi:hypothetical protein